MEIQYSLTVLDLAVISVYLVAVVSLGFWVSAKRQESDDLFLAGRRLGWGNIGLSIFGTNVSPSMLLASCSVAYSSGMVAANFEWLAWIFLMLLAMVFVPHYLTTKVSTMPEFMELRFDVRCRRFLSWYTLFTTLVLWLGGILYSGALLFGQISGWPLWASVLFLTVVATSFTVAGGLEAVVITDSFQSILMIGASATLTIIAALKVGTVDGSLQSVPGDYWVLFRPADDPDFPWTAILLGYPVLGIWFWCTDQTIVQRVLGARSVRQGQLGAIFAAFLKIASPFLFMLPGVLCYVLHPKLENPDLAYMTMVTTHLPSGMVGLVVAVLIAALISTIDSGLNSFSTVFTLDVYCHHFRPHAATKEIVWIGRVSTVGAAVLAMFCAVGMEAIGKDLFNLLQGIIAFFAPPLAAVFTIGVLWRRATSLAALSTLVVGTVSSLTIGYMHLTDWPAKGYWPHYMLVSFYLYVILAVFMVSLSLLTKAPAAGTGLPTLAETYRRGGGHSKLVWALWGVLAALMAAIYVYFN